MFNIIVVFAKLSVIVVGPVHLPAAACRPCLRAANDTRFQVPRAPLFRD